MYESKVLNLIKRGRKQQCIVSHMYFFEDEMTMISEGKWVADKYYTMKGRPENPGYRSRYQRGPNWVRVR